MFACSLNFHSVTGQQICDKLCGFIFFLEQICGGIEHAVNLEICSVPSNLLELYKTPFKCMYVCMIDRFFPMHNFYYAVLCIASIENVARVSYNSFL